MKDNRYAGILDISGVLVSSDIIFERFCCDLGKCRGQCCVEGDAGAPVTMDEVMEIENMLDAVFDDLSEKAQEVIVDQGVACTDMEGELVTSIVEGRDCVFTCYDDIDVDGTKVSGCCLCRLEKAYRCGQSSFCKPASCALYPIRMKTFGDGAVALNYDRWDVCESAREKGRLLNIPVYSFLRGPLVRQFGEVWYHELESVAAQIDPPEMRTAS